MLGKQKQFSKELRRLIDRISTASYGYGGLFSDRDINLTALEQLELFDESLVAMKRAINLASASTAPDEEMVARTQQITLEMMTERS